MSSTKETQKLILSLQNGINQAEALDLSDAVKEAMITPLRKQLQSVLAEFHSAARSEFQRDLESALNAVIDGKRWKEKENRNHLAGFGISLQVIFNKEGDFTIYANKASRRASNRAVKAEDTQATIVACYIDENDGVKVFPSVTSAAENAYKKAKEAGRIPANDSTQFRGRGVNAKRNLDGFTTDQIPLILNVTNPLTNEGICILQEEGNDLRLIQRSLNGKEANPKNLKVADAKVESTFGEIEAHLMAAYEAAKDGDEE